MSDDSNPDPSPAPPDPTGAALEQRPWWSRRGVWALVVVALLSITGIGGAWKLDRIAKDPHFCDSCHTASANESRESPHKNQRCTDCHANRFEENVRQWAYALWSADKKTPHGKFDEKTCKKCHTSGNTEPWQMAKSLGHVKHVLAPEKPLACSDCHKWKEHRSEPDPTTCGKCHDDIKVYGKHLLEDRPEKIGCISCHNYLAKIGGGAQTPSHDCRRCHGGVDKSERSQRYAEVIEAKGIPTSQIHGNLKACSLCHSPHEKDAAKRDKGGDCSRCHVKIPNEYHQEKQPEKFDCASCHEAHGEREDLRKGCNNCHKEQAKPTTTVAARHDRCSECHKPHEFKATFAGCRECHTDQTEMLAAWDSETHAECTNCHKPHSTREEDTTCAKCHKKPGHEHKSCTTCHDPHQSKLEVKTCASCHEKQAHAAARAPARHRAAACLTCHQPHAMAAVGAVCKSCHAKESQATVTAKIDKHTRCSSCHQTHAFSADLQSCRSCHQLPATGAHTGKCNDCHQAHGPPVGKAAACRNCHENIPRSGGKHAKCGTCHKAAHGEVASQPCTACHAEQNALVRLWSPRSHNDCSQCHGTHTTATPKACGDCHKNEDQKVKRTKHTCSSCHEAHAPPRQLWSTCAKCHATESTAVRGRGTKHADCRSCHEQHDARAPTCASCHKDLPRLHGAKDHQKCTTCHDTHRRKNPTRADCLKCHTTRTNHHPEAQQCYGCHLFNNK